MTSFSYVATPEKYRVASSSVHDRRRSISSDAPPGWNVTFQSPLTSRTVDCDGGRVRFDCERARGAVGTPSSGNTITREPYGSRSSATEVPPALRRSAGKGAVRPLIGSHDSAADVSTRNVAVAA